MQAALSQAGPAPCRCAAPRRQPQGRAVPRLAAQCRSEEAPAGGSSDPPAASSARRTILVAGAGLLGGASSAGWARADEGMVLFQNPLEPVRPHCWCRPPAVGVVGCLPTQA